MKNTVSKIVIIGAVLASTLSSVAAAPRHQVTSANGTTTSMDHATYMEHLRNSQDALYGDRFDNEQARRDIGNQGG